MEGRGKRRLGKRITTASRPPAKRIAAAPELPEKRHVMQLTFSWTGAPPALGYEMAKTLQKSFLSKSEMSLHTYRVTSEVDAITESGFTRLEYDTKASSCINGERLLTEFTKQAKALKTSAGCLHAEPVVYQNQVELSVDRD